jgi:hypothetical protein
MTTPTNFFLFSSTLSADAPTKTEKAKDFDSTKNFLSISQHPRSTGDQGKPKITSPKKEPPKPKSTLTDSPVRITPQKTSKMETRKLENQTKRLRKIEEAVGDEKKRIPS